MDVKEKKMEESFKYHIPEDIPANERTAFHGAAAAAAKAGKKNFNFGGKTHPVTMKKDTATKIADQKEEKVNEDPAHYAAIARANARKQAERDKADPEAAKKREKAKAAINKKFSKNPVKPADIGRHSSQGGGFIGRRNEETMTFREKLISVLEGDRKAHYKSATAPEGMLDKSQSSKGAMDMTKGAQDKIKSGAADLDVKKSLEANEKDKADKKMKQAKKRSGGDNVSSGDQNIKPSATPIKDPTAKMEDVEKHDKYGIFGKTMNELLDAVNKVTNKKD